ncbi:MAG: transcription-repair coupling factor [Deltaproteobacteria bacterium]|nr:transcription-repair coupling factor [Deltaproteobacteria bacterium]
MTISPFTAALSRLAENLDHNGSIHLRGLQGSGPALFLSRLAGLEVPGLIVICDDLQRCHDLSRDVSTYLQLINAPEPAPEILIMPPLPRLAYRQTLRSGKIERERIAVFNRIRKIGKFICFTTISAFADRLPEPQTLYRNFTRIAWGEEIDRQALFSRLEATGYVRVPVVDEPGDYSVRGGVVDIFSPLHEDPVRLDFFGDEIESLRPFDHLTQLSRKTELEYLDLGPAREVLPPADLNEARKRVRERYIELNNSNIDLQAALARLEQSPNQPGFEFWLPAFSDQRHTLQDYFPPGSLTLFINPELLHEQLEDLHQQLEEGYRRSCRENRFVFPPAAYLADPEETFASRSATPVILLEEKTSGFACGENSLHIDCQTRDNSFLRDSIRQSLGREGENPLQAAAGLLREHLDRGFTIVLAGRNRTTAEHLKSVFQDYGLPILETATAESDLPALRLHRLQLSRGVLLPDERLLFLSDSDLFGPKRRLRNRRREQAEAFFDDFAEIRPGDLITHIAHGIGRYQGLKTMEIEGIVNEYLILEYQGNDLLYVPVDSFDQLHKYHGGGEGETALSRLGGAQWAAAKEKTRQAIDDLLIELLDLYAEREVVEGRSCQPPDHLFHEFAAAFPYEETPDQQRAIDEVIKDLCAPRPMDRLVSGDVGFGKTEVALRAIFLTVLSGRQAAVLVPTTVLAQQHFETFRERLAGYPVKIAVLSRFRTPAEQKETIAGLKNGSIDVVVGTHRLLQKDISFKDLGLLVLDEEHKFGVRHKEKLKNLRRRLDVLSMSATPIPRTLQFSLSGMRSLSAITTAPRDRLAIRTFVADYDDQVVHDAVTKELDRGGQVFFVHNSVATIEARAARLRSLLPGIRIGIGHGQMKESELEKVMLGFAAHDFDLLLCTTIIESGLDIPNANTMIVEHAQNFGLAQLYQLRGRIGRSQRRAYAYLLVPDLERLNLEARKRLNALAEANTLGAGFRIAMQDLEIRGAGNILGKKQWGQISAVGYELYQEMLNEAIEEARGRKTEKIPDPEVKVGLSAHIPVAYLPDLTLRLQFYKRIAAAENEFDLARLEDELGDRCGPPPEEVLNLLRLKKLKLLLQHHRILSLELGSKKITLHFNPESPPDPDKVLRLLAENPGRNRLTPDYRLTLEKELEPLELYSFCEKLLQKIY